MPETSKTGPMGEWFKNYGVACILLGSAIVGGTIWMVEKEVQAQTAELKSQIARVALDVENLKDTVGSLKDTVGSLQEKVGSIEAQQKKDSAALAEILEWVQRQPGAETQSGNAPK